MKRITVVSALVLILCIFNAVKVNASEGFYAAPDKQESSSKSETKLRAGDEGGFGDDTDPEGPGEDESGPIGDGLAILLSTLGLYGIKVFHSSRKRIFEK